MFERFSEQARAVVVEAQEECRRRHDQAVGAGHLLLGLWFDDDNAAARSLERLGLQRDELRAGLPRPLPDRDALQTLGIDLDAIRERVEAAFGPGALRRPTRCGQPERRHIPFTPQAKRALELALRAALELDHRSIGPAHVLLGVVDAGDLDVSGVLERHGLAPLDVRRAVLAELATGA
jgi:ATP-dependent Clp protease ATP-binding subunit ClpA